MLSVFLKILFDKNDSHVIGVAHQVKEKVVTPFYNIQTPSIITGLSRKHGKTSITRILVFPLFYSQQYYQLNNQV